MFVVSSALNSEAHLLFLIIAQIFYFQEGEQSSHSVLCNNYLHMNEMPSFDFRWPI
jgi:hypothetical protein